MEVCKLLTSHQTKSSFSSSKCSHFMQTVQHLICLSLSSRNFPPIIPRFTVAFIHFALVEKAYPTLNHCGCPESTFQMVKIRHKSPSTIFTAVSSIECWSEKKGQMKLLPLHFHFNNMANEEIDFTLFWSFPSLSISNSEKQTIQYQ